VSRLYRSFGAEVTEERARLMTEQLATTPRDAFGRHRHDLAGFGRNYGDIAAEFGDYVCRYSIAPEAH
jgi:hypothetical protein